MKCHIGRKWSTQQPFLQVLDAAASEILDAAIVDVVEQRVDIEVSAKCILQRCTNANFGDSRVYNESTSVRLSPPAYSREYVQVLPE